MALAGEGKAVIAVARSENSKLGLVSATTASIEGSCPETCALRNNGCYAKNGPLGWMVARMDRHVNEAGLDEIDVAVAEADAIDNIWSGLPLRLHVAGDCKSNTTAGIVSAAAGRYSERNKKPVWTYSHAWRDVARESWGTVSVLASCERPEEALTASQRGYAAAIVVDSFPNGSKAWTLPTGQTAVPCPEMTGAAAACSECKLCFDDKKLMARNAVIAFEIHGTQKKKASLKLKMLNS